MNSKTSFLSNPFNVDSFLSQGAIFGLGSKVWLGWGACEQVLKPENHRLCFATQNFYSHNPSYIAFEHWCEINQEAFFEALQVSGAPAFSKTKQKWIAPLKADFEEKFKVIGDGFKNRGLQKAVPVIFESARGLISATDILSALLTCQPHVRDHQKIYGLWNSQKGFLGMSPELLFKTSDQFKTIQTEAIAGTQALSETVPLTQIPKEMAEHQLVVEDLSQKLRSLGYEVRVDHTDVLELSTLRHLKTKITAKMASSCSHDGMNYQKMVEAFHPSAALGVYPSSLGFEEMSLWDDTSTRDSFGAPFGIVHDKTSAAIVGIRQFRWNLQTEQISLGAGCGVLPESLLQNEWNELEHKRNSVKRIFGI